MALPKLKKNKSKEKDLSVVFKAYAIASIIKVLIHGQNAGDPKLSALLNQCNNAMIVTGHKLGRKRYLTLTLKVDDAISRVSDYKKTRLSKKEFPVVIEMILNLMPKKDMQGYLSVHYTTSAKVQDKDKSALLCMVRALDEELNKEFGTVSSINRDSLGKIMCKPVKGTKTKNKKQKKTISKKERKHNEEVDFHRKKRERIKNFLREKISAVKKNCV